jgi:hypothetical protein
MAIAAAKLVAADGLHICMLSAPLCCRGHYERKVYLSGVSPALEALKVPKFRLPADRNGTNSMG